MDAYKTEIHIERTVKEIKYSGFIYQGGEKSNIADEYLKKVEKENSGLVNQLFLNNPNMDEIILHSSFEKKLCTEERL